MAVAHNLHYVMLQNGSHILTEVYAINNPCIVQPHIAVTPHLWLVLLTTNLPSPQVKHKTPFKSTQPTGICSS